VLLRGNVEAAPGLSLSNGCGDVVLCETQNPMSLLNRSIALPRGRTNAPYEPPPANHGQVRGALMVPLCWSASTAALDTLDSMIPAYAPWPALNARSGPIAFRAVASSVVGQVGGRLGPSPRLAVFA
jgi:hypothetical protein